MDPNANLAEQRRISSRLITVTGADRLAALERLADLSDALDEWISGGGFLPDAWQPAPVPYCHIAVPPAGSSRDTDG